MNYREADFKTELIKALRAAGCDADRFSDLARGVSKPCDLVCGVRGRHVKIETKLRKLGTRDKPHGWGPDTVVVRLADVRPSQHRGLQRAHDAGSVALVLTELRDLGSSRRQAFAVPYASLVRTHTWTLAMFEDPGRTSLTQWPTPPQTFTLTWVPGQGWDVTPLIECVLWRRHV